MKRTICLARATMMLLMMLCSMGAWATITGSGTQDDPYVISSVDDWDTFANPDNAETYWGSNVYVRLGADIPTADDIAASKSITTMVGTSDYKYQGTFDGCGHTLTVNLTHSSGGDAWVAPFKCIYGATIKQLHTAGTITTDGKMAGGIVGDSWGESSIQSCQSSVTINTSVDGDGTHGGLVGRMNDGKLTITDCLFDGSIIGSSTTNCGGFVGWREGTTLNITNCLMAGTFDINVDNNSATFSRNGVSNISNSYYTTALGTAQGIQVFATAPESEITKLQTLIDGNNYYVPCTITGINTSYLYTGETITVTPTVKDADGNTLTKDTHYTIAFTKGGNTVNEVKELGTYTITITAITSGGYTGEKTFTLMVKNELTVYDGTNTNSYIPVCGDFAYNEGTVSEFVIPSGQLTAMVGGTISDLKFYLSSPASEAWTGKFKVYLKEIAEPTLTGITGPDDDGCTVVYTGTLDATGTVMTVTFDDSYTYNGGNLLIGSYIDEGGDFGYAYFYGVEQNENTAWYDIPYELGVAQQFIPKTTFTYIPDKDMPSALTLDEVDASSATLSWTAPTGERTLTGYTYQYKKTTEENWSDEETVTTTSVALSGLTAATAYDFRVKANYSDDGESRYISITFLTDCEAITTFPWTEDFENISASVGGRLNEPCWQNEHISGNGSYFFEVYSSTTGSNSTKQLCLPDMSSGTMTKLRLPVMNLPDNSHYLFALDVYRSSSSNMIDEGIRVFASTDGKIEGAQEMAFIPRVRSVGNSIIPTESADGWYTYDLLIPMSGTCYIILRGESQNGTSTYMDNFEVKVAPSCISPIGLIASNVTSTSTTLSWTERGSASAWVLQYGTDENFTAGTYTETMVENNPTTILTGLTPESIYYARVKPECDTEGYNWSIPVTFEPTAKVTIGSGTNNSGCVPIDNSYSYSLTQQIYTVAELGGAGLIESIDFYKYSTYFCRRKIDIYMVNTSKSSFESTSDWIPVTDADLVFSGAVTFADNDWTSITLDNPFIYDGTQNVAIIVDDNSGFFEFDTSNFLTYPVSEYQSLYYCQRNSYDPDIDPSNPSAEDKGRISNKNQIRILKSPFGMPENFMATKVGPTQATLTWVETGAATKWVVAYKKTGDATFTEVHATTNSYTLTGLSNETAYTVKVRPANNDDLWSSEITFTTTVDNPVPTDVAVSDISHTSATVNWTGFGESYNVRYRMHAIFEEGFENGLGSWTMQNQDSRTGVNWRAANHGSNGFMFYYNSNPPQYLISPEITKECTLLEFYYKNFSIYYQETFHVGFSSTTNSTDAFTFGDEITAADAQWHLCQVPIPAGTKYICWKLTSNDQYCLCIDDIVVSVTTDWTNTSVTEESLSLEGLTAGITYHCQVQSVKDGETTDWSPVTEFTIPLAVGTLTEAEGVTYLTTNASGQNDVPVEFSRSFTMNVASTICLPFPMTRITGGKVYQFVGVEYDNTDGWMATMSDATPDNKVTSTEANKPYLFMPTKTGNVTFSGTIAKVASSYTPVPTTSGDWTFRGTYSRLTYEEESNSNLFSGKAFGFAASGGESGVVAGEFVRAVEGASIRAFRAFLIYSGADPDLLARATRGGTGIPDRITVRLIGKEGEIDGIGEISLSTGEVTFDPNAWYDLSGRRLDGKPTKKGVYINNGRKIAIK